MRAENCDRFGWTDPRGGRHTYGSLRKYVCNECGGGVVHLIPWNAELEISEDKVGCARCGSEEIIKESTYNRQISDALEETYIQREWIRRTGMGLLDVIEQGRKGRTERLGKIRLGWTEETPNSDWDKVVASDHFVFTDAPLLAELFGEEKSSLPIRFPHAKFDDNILASYMVWGGGRKKGSGICLCEGNGRNVLSALPFTTRVNQKSGRVSVNRGKGDRRVSWGKAFTDFTWEDGSEAGCSFKVGDKVPCPGSAGDLYTHCDACSPSILLKIQVRHPKLSSYGYWQITTQSINNYLHLMKTWDDITKEGKLDIPMSMVPFILSITPGATLFQNQKDKSWGKRDAFYLNLAVDPDVAKLLQGYQAHRFIELMQGQPLERPQLEAPAVEDAEGEGPEWEEGVFEDAAESEPPQAPAERVPAPLGLDHKTITKFAAELLGYENIGQVKAALLSIVGPRWNRNTEWSPSDVWVQLQDHLRAPKE